MTYTVIDHGVWEIYTPVPPLPGAPETALFSRRIGDGVDWYAYLHGPATLDPETGRLTYGDPLASWAEDGLLATVEGERVQAVQRERDKIFPGRQGLIEIVGVDPGLPVSDAQAAFGQTLVDRAAGTFTHPPKPLDQTRISRRQFYQQLALNGEISEVEALAALQTGTIPDALQAALKTLCPAERFSAALLLAGEPELARHHPLIVMIQAAMGWSEAQLDTLWTHAKDL